MANIPNRNLTEDAVENTEPAESKLRPYIGYSGLGHDCPNYLWLTFRWAYKKTITPRLARLFNRGHQEEPIIVADLERAGISCSNTGVFPDEEQVSCVGFMGHIKGHPDGDAIGVPEAPTVEHNLEMKTANDKNFKQFAKFGVKYCSMKYFVQIQFYMHHKKQKRTLFVMTNKNTDERYYERIHYDPLVVEQFEARGVDVLLSPVPMAKISKRIEWHACQWCDAKKVCHGLDKPEVNCRTCKNLTIKDEGKFGCKLFPGADIPEEFQRKGCGEHDPIF